MATAQILSQNYLFCVKPLIINMLGKLLQSVASWNFIMDTSVSCCKFIWKLCIFKIIRRFL